MSPPSAGEVAPPTLYFAYGSNLSLSQMSSRCPSSEYHSLGVLKGYRWVIGPRGYANIIKAPSQSPEDVVYGLLYSLYSQTDERALDRAEGVPDSYTRHRLRVELLTVDGPEGEVVGLEGEGQGPVRALVYVDEKRVGEGVCQEEYVARMNRGIRDAVSKGMPVGYVQGVLRKWVRDEPVPDDEEVDDPFHPDKM